MASKLLTTAAARFNSWLNLVTGVGVAGNRADFTFRADPNLDDQTLEDLYHQDPFAARIVDLVPREAMRQGYTITAGDPEIESRIASRLTDLDADSRLTQAWIWGRTFGGGAVFMGVDDGRDPREPLDENALRDVHFLTVLDKREMIPSRWYADPLSPKFGTPEVYRFARAGGVGVDTREVHETRLLRFQGSLTTRRRQVQLQGWGESELQRVVTVLRQFNANFAAVSTLVQDASQGVFGIKDLYELMAGDDQDKLKKRLELMDLSRSVARSILIDADEESFARVETGALTGLADVLDKFALYLSGAARMPVSLLLGQAPAGLNATGDSDVRWWYDNVRSDQTTKLAPNLTRLISLLLRCDNGPTGGLEPEKWSIEFTPLWQMTPKEEAELRKMVADTDAIYLTNQVVTPEEVAVNRFRPEGWSAETSLDMAARKAVIEADVASTGPTAPVDPDGVSGVVAKVAGRELPRDAGLAQLIYLFGLAPEVAESLMGEAGRSFFTKPDPAQVAGLDALQVEHAKLQASNRGVRQYLSRVLEKNRNGELVVGSIIAASPTDLEAGEELEAGDVVQVPNVPTGVGPGTATPATAPTVATKAPEAQTGPDVDPTGTPPDATEGGIKAEPLPPPDASSPIWTPPAPKGGPAPGSESVPNIKTPYVGK